MDEVAGLGEEDVAVVAVLDLEEEGYYAVGGEAGRGRGRGRGLVLVANSYYCQNHIPNTFHSHLSTKFALAP